MLGACLLPPERLGPPLPPPGLSEGASLPLKRISGSGGLQGCKARCCSGDRGLDTEENHVAWSLQRVLVSTKEGVWGRHEQLGFRSYGEPWPPALP